MQPHPRPGITTHSQSFVGTSQHQTPCLCPVNPVGSKGSLPQAICLFYGRLWGSSSNKLTSLQIPDVLYTNGV